MPQMSPLMWLVLFLVFSSILLISVMKTHFLIKPSTSSISESNMLIKKKLLNWKW